ncbi:hypothetical protein LJC07_08070 [Christensenellaceae bacterium OttesenSCG-928-L17]|nr:hypothetical protein [Christensenellaceae bacterium OttesenSCG-928-L17]
MKKFLAITLLLSILLCAMPAMAEQEAVPDEAPTTTMYIRNGGGVYAYMEPKVDESLILNGQGDMWIGRAIMVVEYGEEWCKVRFDKAYMSANNEIIFKATYAYIQTKHMSEKEYSAVASACICENKEMCDYPYPGYCDLDCPDPSCNKQAEIKQAEERAHLDD